MMRYYTPDLLLRFGSEDDRIADAAHEEADMAQKAYLKHVRTFRSKLPAGGRLLTSKICLHDARVKMVATRKNPLALTLILQLAKPSTEVVQLFYDLAAKPKVIAHPRLAEPGTPLEWLYDEFDLVKNGPPRTFTHSILFTGGHEIQLTFRGLKVQVFENFKWSESEGAENQLGALVEV